MASRNVVDVERDGCVAAPALLRLRAGGMACDCSPVASLSALETKACLPPRQVEPVGNLQIPPLSRPATRNARPTTA